MLQNVQKPLNYFDLPNFVTSKSTKLAEIITLVKVDISDKKSQFCHSVRTRAAGRATVGSKTYLHLLYTHIDMQICIKAALLPFQKRTNQRWQPCSGTGPLRP